MCVCIYVYIYICVCRGGGGGVGDVNPVPTNPIPNDLAKVPSRPVDPTEIIVRVHFN